MAKQVIVTTNNTVQVAIEPTPNVEVQISRTSIGTVANVLTANYANYAGNAVHANNATTAGTVTTNAQPNITSVGTLTNLAVSGDITTVDSITFDQAASEAYTTAKLWWNTVDGTFNMGMYNNVTQQVGQELFFYGKAQGNITNGQVVMFAGVQGDHILLAPANAASPGFKKEFIVGIATQNINNGSFGYVTWFGKVNDVNTNGFPAGSILWFNPSVVGGLTNVEPTGTSIRVLMAAVIKAETSPSANNGILLVRPTFEPSINDIQGVSISGALNGQVLTYNALNNTWVNANVVANVSNVAYAAFAGNANVAFSVDGSNVNGPVANANYADNAGNANIANIAYSVNVANVTGIGNIATINLDGNVANALLGDGTFGPVELTTANYANFAGNAYSVDGANVVGSVSDAVFASTAGVAYSIDGANVSGEVASAALANIANEAYLVSGANVNGEVANAAYAAYAANAGYADTANSSNYSDIANTAYAVDVANVSGIGNIATVNLDGNVANALLGDGTWGPVELANAAYANVAGVAYSVDGANVLGEVANAAYAGFAGVANSVDGANVSGAVANATYADTANVANIANTAYAVDVANVSGIGNIATINLTGNGDQTLLGNGTWGALPNTANANYANFAGNAFSVDGANVVGEVANAAYANVAGIAYFVDGANVNGEVANATYANDANIANFAYSADGANIIGTVANATYADNAGNANIAYSVDGANVVGAVANATYADTANVADIANTAYAVDVANVIGIGNIATINLDGNASNLLDGTGNWVAIPTVSANANYANFAGEVTNSAQPNITSVGNLTSLTVNNTTSGNTLQFDPAGITVGSNTFVEVRKTDLDTKDIVIVNNLPDFGGTFNKEFHVTEGANIVPYATFETYYEPPVPGNAATNGGIGLSVYSAGSDLATGNPTSKTTFTVSNAINVTIGEPTSGNLGVYQTFSYGMGGAPASSTAMRFTRRRGNASARLSLEPNDYLGNIEWRGSQAGGATPTGGRFAKIAPRVDSSYVANTGAQPVGIEFWVTDNTTARSHTFYANGNVNFNGTVNAIAFTGNGAGLTNITTSPAGNTTEIQFNNAGALAASANFTYDDSTGTLNANVVNPTTFLNVSPNNAYSSYILGNGYGFDWQLLSLGSDTSLGSINGNLLMTGGQFGTKLLMGNANLFTNAGNIVLNGDDGNIIANTITANYFYGDGSNITGVTATATPAGSNTQIQFNDNGVLGASNELSFDQSINQLNVGNVGIQNRSIVLNGLGEQPPANSVYSSVGVVNGAFSLSQDNIGGGLATFAFSQYENVNSYLNPYTFFRARGNASSPEPVQPFDIVMNQSFFCYGDSGNTYVGLGAFYASATSNDLAGNVSADIGIFTQNSNDGSSISLSTDIINLNAASQVYIQSNLNVGFGNIVLDNSGIATVSDQIQVAGGAITLDGSAGNISVANAISINSGTINLDGTTGLVTATESAIANTTLSQYQETTYNYGNATGTISPDFALGSIQKLTLTGNITLNSLTNAVAGRSMTLILTQGATGGRTLTSSWKFAGASKTLSTAANAIDIISVFYDGTTYYASLSKGYA